MRAAQQDGVHTVLVKDADIVHARRALWDDRRLAVEHAAATALAALIAPDEARPARAGYRPAPGEKICVVLCGANTDPTDLTQPPTADAPR